MRNLEVSKRFLSMESLEILFQMYKQKDLGEINLIKYFSIFF